eukprot:GHVT01027855.1.p1 GENE.GHVT01027855.1~~GHVT01027855.1.p1  ORF type:complete len:367 (-),score=69.93 GHVT01027855.1:431-1531(-)
MPFQVFFFSIAFRYSAVFAYGLELGRSHWFNSSIPALVRSLLDGTARALRARTARENSANFRSALPPMAPGGRLSFTTASQAVISAASAISFRLLIFRWEMNSTITAIAQHVDAVVRLLPSPIEVLASGQRQQNSQGQRFTHVYDHLTDRRQDRRALPSGNLKDPLLALHERYTSQLVLATLTPLTTGRRGNARNNKPKDSREETDEVYPATFTLNRLVARALLSILLAPPEVQTLIDSLWTLPLKKLQQQQQDDGDECTATSFSGAQPSVENTKIHSPLPPSPAATLISPRSPTHFVAARQELCDSIHNLHDAVTQLHRNFRTAVTAFRRILAAAVDAAGRGGGGDGGYFRDDPLFDGRGTDLNV